MEITHKITCLDCYWLDHPHAVNGNDTCAEKGRDETDQACPAYTQINPYEGEMD